MVDDEHFLIQFGSRLGYFKFNLSTFDLSELSLVELDDRVRFGNMYLDQLDKERFMIYDVNRRVYCTGHIRENQIIFDQISNLDTDHLQFCKFAGNKLCGLTDTNQQWHYREFDVETKAVQTTEAPFTLNDEQLSLYGVSLCLFFKMYLFRFQLCPFVWCGKNLCVAIWNYIQNCCKIVTFNSESRKWTNTRIEIVRQVNSMFMDNDGFLTIIKDGYKNTTSVYRFPLR
jgi:hypothetical protein